MDECLAYLGDGVMLGRDFQDQRENLLSVFLRFQKYNLKLKTGKCQFIPTKVKFLGKVVNRNGISVNTESIDAVKRRPRPNNIIDFTNYHRDHINKLSELAEPLHQLAGTKNAFECSEDQQRSFQSWNEALVHAVVLSYDDVLA